MMIIHSQIISALFLISAQSFIDARELRWLLPTRHTAAAQPPLQCIGMNKALWIESSTRYTHLQVSVRVRMYSIGNQINAANSIKVIPICCLAGSAKRSQYAIFFILLTQIRRSTGVSPTQLDIFRRGYQGLFRVQVPCTYTAQHRTNNQQADFKDYQQHWDKA